ncbi:glycosyltransferase family 39 protein [Pedobacter gandavensis]|uniref:ArnT family glycosyltransferase n=1 Tax=Pedobacter gandavensis TaxID=2679963 RepID=UPI00292CE1C9|nr:glycosyltransferase family 39 protein [Pedobacter gandavensis]
MNLKSKLPALLPYFIGSVFLLFCVLRVLIIFSKGTDIAGIEQNVIYSTQVFMDSAKLYLFPSDAPFSITQYTPVYYYLCGFTAKILGFNASDIPSLYIIGRIWSMIFNLITAIFIFKIASNLLKLSKNTSYLLFLMSFVYGFAHNFAVRPDSLQDMMGIASIYCFMCYYKKRDSGSNSFLLLALTVALSAISFFAKQSGLQFIIIFLGFSILNKDWRTFLKLSLVSILIYGALMLLFRIMYPSFLHNIFGGVANGINIDNYIKFILTRNIFILTVWPLILVTLYIFIKNNTIFKGNATERLLSLAALGSLIFAAVTALKMGSTVQYFIIFINLSLLIIAKNFEGKKINTLFQTYLILVVFVYAAHNVKIIRNFDHNPYLEKQRAAARKVVEYIRNNRVEHSGRSLFANLSTDSTLPSRQQINNEFFDICIIPQMDILEYSTGPLKIIDYKRIENMMQSGEIEFIIESLPKSKFSIIDKLETIKNTNFKPVKEIDGYVIYKFNVQ